MKELEILKFKMIAFVKTYENEFSKMKSRISELELENRSLKKKLSSGNHKRLSSANHQNILMPLATNTTGFNGS
jgi:hypothetical protein